METITLGALVARLNEILSERMEDGPVLLLMSDESVVPIEAVRYDADMRCYVLVEGRHVHEPEDRVH